MVTTPINTERMILRTMTQIDAKAVWEMWADHEVGKYLQDPYYHSPEELRALFTDIEEWPNYPFVAIEKNTGEIIGTCGIGPESTPEEWGLGYCLKRDKWGQGYAMEMVKALINFAHAKEINNLIAECAVENAASGRVLQKCGMKLDRKSHFKKSRTDIVYPSHIYTLNLKRQE